jgi:putative glutamine amidotransferase
MSRQTRPIIGINGDFIAAGKNTTPHLRLAIGYADAVLAAGGLPVILPPLDRETDPDIYLDRLDGIILSGGADIDPRRQGLPTHPSVQPMAVRRDDSDRRLVERIVENRFPVLAIGVGVQQLALATGGSLYLHLPEDLPRAMPHRDPTGQPHRHGALIEPGSRLEEIYGAGEIRVNSMHHQAIRQVGTGFRVGARSLDGVIEAIESTDSHWFCVGVQWHPEADTATALDAQLFEGIVQACSTGELVRLAA